MEETIRRRLKEVRERIGEAASHVGRDPSDIRLIVVTKTVGPGVMEVLARCGVSDIGENYVQQAAAKKEILGQTALTFRWHMIGHLQRNKAKKAVTLFDCIHSLDSIKLADELAKRARNAGKTLPVYIEVKTSEEPTKHGVDEKDVPMLLEHVLSLDGLRFVGLMTMAPYFDESEKARPYFAKLRKIADFLKEHFGVESRLSMGMTSDYEVAVEEGATDVRIGTAIVGGL